MKRFTKAELIDFRDRLIRARDWEWRVSGDREGFSYVCTALARNDILVSDDVRNFVFGGSTGRRKEIAALFANSIADIDRRIARMK